MRISSCLSAFTASDIDYSRVCVDVARSLIY